MKKILLLTGAVFLGLCSAANAAVDCSTPPSCDALGYSESEDACSGQRMLRCPFDTTKVFCPEPLKQTTCLVGSILYKKKKCYDGTPSGKTPLGIVFDSYKRRAVSLTAPVPSLPWGGYGTDISNLTNCIAENYRTCDIDGQVNTQIINAKIYGSAHAAGFCAKEGGFLPSMYELKMLYSNKTYVNNAIQTLPNPDTILIGNTNYLWSSNEIGDISAHTMNLSDGSFYFNYKDRTNSFVLTRCVYAY